MTVTTLLFTTQILTYANQHPQLLSPKLFSPTILPSPPHNSAAVRNSHLHQSLIFRQSRNGSTFHHNLQLRVCYSFDYKFITRFFPKKCLLRILADIFLLVRRNKSFGNKNNYIRKILKKNGDRNKNCVNKLKKSIIIG